MGAEKPSKTTGRAQQHNFIAVGRVIRPHGVRGNLLVEPISDLIQTLDQGVSVHLGEARDPAEIVFAQPHKDRYLVSVDICQSREQAELWRDQELYLRADQSGDLPADTYYHWQIIDMRVETVDGQDLGRVTQVLVTGANDVYVVEMADGGELLLPATDEVVQEIDVEAGRMVVKLLPGLLPD